MNYELPNGEHNSALHDRVAYVDSDAGNGAGLLSLDVVLHLHGFENDDNVTDAYFIANLDIDGIDSAG